MIGRFRQHPRNDPSLLGHFQTALYAFFALTVFLGLDFAVRRPGVRGYLRALCEAGRRPTATR